MPNVSLYGMNENLNVQHLLSNMDSSYGDEVALTSVRYDGGPLSSPSISYNIHLSDITHDMLVSCRASDNTISVWNDAHNLFGQDASDYVSTHSSMVIDRNDCEEIAKAYLASVTDKSKSYLSQTSQVQTVVASIAKDGVSASSIMSALESALAMGLTGFALIDAIRRAITIGSSSSEKSKYGTCYSRLKTNRDADGLLLDGLLAMLGGYVLLKPENKSGGGVDLSRPAPSDDYRSGFTNTCGTTTGKVSDTGNGSTCDWLLASNTNKAWSLVTSYDSSSNTRSYSAVYDNIDHTVVHLYTYPNHDVDVSSHIMKTASLTDDQLSYITKIAPYLPPDFMVTQGYVNPSIYIGNILAQMKKSGLEKFIVKGSDTSQKVILSGTFTYTNGNKINYCDIDIGVLKSGFQQNYGRSMADPGNSLHQIGAALDIQSAHQDDVYKICCWWLTTNYKMDEKASEHNKVKYPGTYNGDDYISIDNTYKVIKEPDNTVQVQFIVKELPEILPVTPPSAEAANQINGDTAKHIYKIFNSYGYYDVKDSPYLTDEQKSSVPADEQNAFTNLSNAISDMFNWVLYKAPGAAISVGVQTNLNQVQSQVNANTQSLSTTCTALDAVAPGSGSTITTSGKLSGMATCAQTDPIVSAATLTGDTSDMVTKAAAAWKAKIRAKIQSMVDRAQAAARRAAGTASGITNGMTAKAGGTVTSINPDGTVTSSESSGLETAQAEYDGSTDDQYISDDMVVTPSAVVQYTVNLWKALADEYVNRMGGDYPDVFVLCDGISPAPNGWSTLAYDNGSRISRLWYNTSESNPKFISCSRSPDSDGNYTYNLISNSIEPTSEGAFKEMPATSDSNNISSIISMM